MYMVGLEGTHGRFFAKMDLWTAYKIGQSLEYKGRLCTVISCVQIDEQGFALK